MAVKTKKGLKAVAELMPKVGKVKKTHPEKLSGGLGTAVPTVAEPTPKKTKAKKSDAPNAGKKLDDKVLIWTGPTTAETKTSAQHHWTTQCGRYRVSRVQSSVDKEEPFYFFAAYGPRFAEACEKPDTETGRQQRYPNLSSALTVAENRHCYQLHLPDVNSNRDEVLKAAKDAGLDRVMAPSSPLIPRGGRSPHANGGSGKSSRSSGGAATPRVRGQQILGHSATKVVRWMGKDGFDAVQGRAVLSFYNIVFTDSSLKAILKEGATGNDKWGPPADVDADQAKTLRKVAGKK